MVLTIRVNSQLTCIVMTCTVNKETGSPSHVGHMIVLIYANPHLEGVKTVIHIMFLFSKWRFSAHLTGG